ncbi:MAG: carboxypeptidase-like regulatory domain-containing protein [Hymenobacter sp.]
MWGKVMRQSWGLLLVLLVAAGSARGQGAAALRGTVVDSLSGQPLPGVSVGLVGQPVGTATDALGQFQLRNLRPGPVMLRVAALGYRPQTSR